MRNRQGSRESSKHRIYHGLVPPKVGTYPWMAALSLIINKKLRNGTRRKFSI